MRIRFAVSLTAAWALIAAPVLAQEHPEHPKKDAARSESTKDVTNEQLSAAIRSYVERDSKLKGGYFLIYDGVDKKPLQLTLVKVHDDKLASLGDGVYFACTDLKNADGVVYDLDFFMKQGGHGLETTEVAVHKKDGKPRYGWKEEGGTWKKVTP